MECDALKDILAVVHFALTLVQWVVPIVLIAFGTVDLTKSVIAGKEDEIQKGQKTLVKRLIAAVLVFLVPLIVSTIMGLIGSDDWKQCYKEAGELQVKDLLKL